MDQETETKTDSVEVESNFADKVDAFLHKAKEKVKKVGEKIGGKKTLTKPAEEIIDFETIRDIIAAPADAMLLKTGNGKRWNIPKSDIERAAKPAYRIVQRMENINPEKIDIALLVFHGLNLYLFRTIEEIKDYKLKKHAMTLDAEKQKNGNGNGK